MNIWYISKYANADNDSPTRQFFISKYLKKRGHNINLIYSQSNGYTNNRFYKLSKSIAKDNVNCIILNGPNVNLGFNKKRIYSWIIFEINLFIYSITKFFNKKPDLIIASSLSLLTFFTAVVLKKILRCKLILEVRDIWPDTLVQSGKYKSNSFLVKLLKFIEIFGYKNADGIISTLPKFDMYLRDNGITNFKFKHIPQGIDLDLIKQDCTPSVNNQKFTVCYAGTIGKVNYVEELLTVATELKDLKTIEFYILGDGPLKNIMLEKYGHLDNIKFFDSINKKEVIPFLSKCDLLVNMWGNFSIYNYGVSPNKWIDYMMSGRPILVSYSGYKSILNNANCAFFTESNNIQQLKEKILIISKMDKEILNTMGHNGKTYAISKLNYEYLSEDLNNFINSI